MVLGLSMDALWESLEYVGESLVFAGVVGEVLTERVLVLKRDKERRDAVEGVSSWVLIVGLAISLAALIETNEYFNGTVAALNLQAKKAEERAAQFQSQIAESDARVKVAEAQVASAKAASLNAVARVAAAEASSKKASAKAEGFRLDIARAAERAAKATATAEHERLARLQIEQRLAPRLLAQEDQRQMESALQKLDAQNIDIILTPGNPEAENLARQMAFVFGRLKWRSYFYTPMGGTIQGIRVQYDGQDKSATNAAALLAVALRSAGLEVTGPFPILPPMLQQLGAFTSSEGATGTARIRLFVGAK